MKKFFRVRVSRTTVISSAGAVAKLVENLSEAVNFGPTKGAAKIVQQMLQTLKEVDANDDARFLLIKRVVDFLLLIREHFDRSDAILSSNMTEKMQEFEALLFKIHEDLKPTEKGGFAKRAISREKIKGDLADHSAALDAAIGKLNLSLLLGLTVAAQMALICNNPPDSNPSGIASVCGTLVGQRASTQDRDDEFLEDLRNEYDEVRVCEVQRIPSNKDPVRSTAVAFSNLSYAFVKGERRLVKSFDGGDEHEREEWLKEVKHWHRLKHPNLLQMYGFSKKTSPHLYVVFQNGQARCLATYILDALNNSDVPSIAAEIAKICNAAMSAIRHAARQLHVNDAMSVLVAEDATFALDSGDNLIVSMNPLRAGGRDVQPLFDTLRGLLYPPMKSRDMNSYFARLKASNDSLSIPDVTISRTTAAVRYFIYDYYSLVEDKGGFFLELLAETSNQRRPVFAASIDYGSKVEAGDYGVFVDGKDAEFSFQAYGNACCDSPEIIRAENHSLLWNGVTGKWNPVVQESPRVWSIDLNEAHLRGYSAVPVQWQRRQTTGSIQAMQRWFVNSAPFLLHVDHFEDLVLVTEVIDHKLHELAIQETAPNEPHVKGAPLKSVTTDSPLPTVYATEPNSQKDELQFSQCLPQSCSPSCKCWDARVICKGKTVQWKHIHYIQLARKDVVERFGYVPAAGRKRRARHSTAPIIRRNRWKELYWREYELILQRSEPWCEKKTFSNEYL